MKEEIKEQIEELIENTYQEGVEAGREESSIDAEFLIKQGRDQGRDEAWDAAKKLVAMDSKECSEVLGQSLLLDDEIFEICTASEAIEKIKIYEGQKRLEKTNEIHIGDEVIVYCGTTRAVVIAIDKTEIPYKVLMNDGTTEWFTVDGIDRKTGRHFPEIIKMLKKLKEEIKE